ncbi:unnamed protein product, partial [Ectocarpus fasciculatus]
GGFRTSEDYNAAEFQSNLCSSYVRARKPQPNQLISNNKLASTHRQTTAKATFFSREHDVSLRRSGSRIASATGRGSEAGERGRWGSGGGGGGCECQRGRSTDRGVPAPCPHVLRQQRSQPRGAGVQRAEAGPTGGPPVRPAGGYRFQTRAAPRAKSSRGPPTPSAS